MTTAIMVATSSGIVGRCDARCHDAKQEPVDARAIASSGTSGYVESTTSTTERSPR